MANLIDLTGQAFGRLTVLSRDTARLSIKPRWLCQCACNANVSVFGYALRSGHTQSCGCLQRERAIVKNKSHGHSRTSTYNSWVLAKRRCHNPTNPKYSDYGGRGIYMCESWRNDFAVFLRDMGPKPSPAHSIDRIDNDGPYSPDNCRWATNTEQSKNKRSNLILTFNGVSKTASDWDRHFGFGIGTVRQRIERDWSIEKALTTQWMGRRKGRGWRS